MLRFIATLFLVLSGTVQFASAADTYFKLDDTSIPLAVRVEKAQGLLRAWGFASPEFAEQFVLNDAASTRKVQQALKTLLDRNTDSASTAERASSEAEHYVTWALARAQMLNGLDFSDQALRHFFSVNPKQYQCEPTAKVSELLVPATYVDTLDTTAVLSEIAHRLMSEQFGRVAYETSLKYGKPDPGFKGDVTQKTVGADRFKLYKLAQAAGGVGGPYKVADGYLFVQVHKIVSNEDQCYQFHHDQIVQDYGREWLKKIYADTLTTAARQLKPLVTEVTSVPLTSDIAYLVDGHSVTFAQARATLPFLFGDDKSLPFWKSIQRQALEVELIYHSQAGQAIRASDEYRQQLKVLTLLSDAQKQVKQVLAQESTTASIQAWYQQNRKQFTETTTVSYTLYRCDAAAGAIPATTVSLTAAQCAATLEKLRGDPTVARKPLTGSLISEKVTSQTWASRSREIQVACQELRPGEWSQVFSIDAKPQVLHLEAIDRKTPEPAEIWPDISARYEMDKRIEYWQRFVGII